MCNGTCLGLRRFLLKRGLNSGLLDQQASTEPTEFPWLLFTKPTLDIQRIFPLTLKAPKMKTDEFADPYDVAQNDMLHLEIQCLPSDLFFFWILNTISLGQNFYFLILLQQILLSAFSAR